MGGGSVDRAESGLRAVVLAELINKALRSVPMRTRGVSKADVVSRSRRRAVLNVQGTDWQAAEGYTCVGRRSAYLVVGDKTVQLRSRGRRVDQHDVLLMLPSSRCSASCARNAAAKSASKPRRTTHTPGHGMERKVKERVKIANSSPTRACKDFLVHK